MSLGLLLAWMMAGAALPALASPELDTRDWMTQERVGGNATVYAYGKGAYTHAFAGLNLRQRQQFSQGAEAFNAVLQAPPGSTIPSASNTPLGLGPSFNAASCAQCHVRDGRSVTFAGLDPLSPLVLQKSLPDGKRLPMQSNVPGFTVLVGDADERILWEAFDYPLPENSPKVTVELRRPRFASGVLNQTYPNLPMLRAAPAVFGLGMLEAIDDTQLMRRAKLRPWAKYGITGKIRWVTGPSSPRARPGRFGWKGEHANLPDQIAHALLDEMGITSHLLVLPSASHHGNLPVPEIPRQTFGQLVAYMRFLGVPARQDILYDAVLRGAKLFEKAHCAMCHQPENVAGNLRGTSSSNTPLPVAMRGQKIYPFTDLLLHDMGEPLASGLGPWRRYWKTPALWGIGVQKQVAENAGYLHDGRARNLLEAILWHGGEAESSRVLFEQMTVSERQQLIQFLETL